MQKDQESNKLSDEDLQTIIEFEEEQHRLGNFEKIFPCINNDRYYGKFFEYPRHSNNLLSKYLHCINQKQNQHHVCYMPQNIEGNQGDTQIKDL